MKVNLTQVLLASLLLTQVPGMLRAANKYQSHLEARQACLKWRESAPTRTVTRVIQHASPGSTFNLQGVLGRPARPEITEDREVPTEKRLCNLDEQTDQIIAELDGKVINRYRF